MSFIEVLFFQPGQKPFTRTVEATRAALRELVGSPRDLGTCALERCRSGRAVELFHDGRGRERGLGPCLYVAGPDFQGTPVFGPAVAMRLSDYRRGVYESITPEEVEFYSRMPTLAPRAHALPREVPYRLVDEDAARDYLVAVQLRRRDMAQRGERIA